MLGSMSSWYVSYRAANATAMALAADREHAVDVACAMLGRGIDVRSVGPLVEAPEGNVLDAAAIREIGRMRSLHAGQARAA